MIKRLFALMVLVLLVGVAVFYWKARPEALSGPREALSEVSEKLRDAKTAGTVKAALELHREVAPFPIDVSARGDGIVTLTGRVPSQTNKATAGRVAEAVPGVKSVVNEIVLSSDLEEPAPGDRTLGESLDDRALEAKVHLAHSLNRNLKDAHVSVKAYRREVVLTGSAADKAQRELAAQIAETTPQVLRVVNMIRVPGEPSESGSPEEVLAPAQRVKRALVANPNLAPYAIEIQEKDGHVILTGTVKTGAEKDLASYVAREAAAGPVENALRVAS